MEITSAEHVCIVTWCLVCGVVSIVGNTAVLLAASVYRAIRLDKIAVILITNLAVAGTHKLPIFNQWVLLNFGFK